MVVSLETLFHGQQKGQYRCRESEASRQGHLFAWWMQELDLGLAIRRQVCAEDTAELGHQRTLSEKMPESPPHRQAAPKVSHRSKRQTEEEALVLHQPPTTSIPAGGHTPMPGNLLPLGSESSRAVATRDLQAQSKSLPNDSQPCSKGVITVSPPWRPPLDPTSLVLGGLAEASQILCGGGACDCGDSGVHHSWGTLEAPPSSLLAA